MFLNKLRPSCQMFVSRYGRHLSNRKLSFAIQALKQSSSSQIALKSLLTLGFVGSGYLGWQYTRVFESMDDSYISAMELAKHWKPSDAWIAIDGEVYDITSLLESHPGGSAILLDYAGRDATEAFHHLKHSELARSILPGLSVGKLKEGEVKEYKTPNPAKYTDSDVIVIGAGICGVSAAHFLSQKGYRVTVLDKAPVVGGTGLKSSAIMWIGPALEKADKPGVGMRSTEWLGYQSFNILKSRSDIEFRERGTIGLIQNEEQMERALQVFGPNGRMPNMAKFLTTEELLEMEPEMSPDLLGATYHHLGATCDPYSLCRSFMRSAIENGALFAFNTMVTGLEKVEDSFVVQTDGVSYHAPKVLICVGWQAKEIAGWRGHNVPVEGVHGQMIAFNEPDVKLNHHFYGWEALTYWGAHKMKDRTTRLPNEPYERLTRHFYGLQIKSGAIKVGGDRIKRDLAGEVLEDGTESTRQHVGELIPRLKGAPILGQWSGTMPFTPDQRNILGELEEGLYVLTGSGFMRGAACGRLLASLVSKSTTPKEDQILEECSPQRFKQKMSVTA